MHSSPWSRPIWPKRLSSRARCCRMRAHSLRHIHSYGRDWPMRLRASPTAGLWKFTLERWALDEAPLPGRLVHQILEWLYRENQFCRGALTVLGRRIGPSDLDLPTLAVVN